MSSPAFSPPTPWHKARSAKVFFFILGFFGLIGVGFLSLTGYYFFQFKSGKISPDENKLYSGGFTNLGGAAVQTTDDPTKYIRPENAGVGSQSPKATILAFLDAECPYCQEDRATIERIINEFGAAVRVIFKNFPIESIHPRSVSAALAAECADETGQFWPYFSSLLTNKRFERADLLDTAKTLGLPEKTFSDCLDSRRHEASVIKDLEDGLSLKVRGTPTYFIGQTKIEGVISYDNWRQIILDEINR